MPTITPTVTTLAPGVFQAVWASMANGDVGGPVVLPAAADKCVQFYGTFGTGGNAVLKGQNGGSNYIALKDPDGNQIAMTAEALVQVRENPLRVRPEITGGDGTTSLTCSIVAK